MASKIQRELALLLTGKDISASRSIKGVNSELGKLHQAGAKAGRSVARNLEQGVIVGAAAATTAVGFAVKQAMDFESSSASVAKTVEGNIATILRANRELAKTTGLEVNALNEISATAGALGVANDDVDDFTKTVALLGVTTDDVSTELGATSLGHLSTTLKLAGDDFEHVGNTLVFLGNHGASTEGQILSMTENIAGAADVIGASTPQVLGWAAALANTGEEAEAGGSSIQRFWLESFKSVNAGGKKLALMAKTTGMTARQFKTAFGKDASGTLAKFVVGLGKLSKAEQLAALKALGFKDIRIQRALLKLLANTDNLTDSLADSEKGWDDNKAATDEAAKRFETTASKLNILKANVNDAAITIGSELLPVLADLSTDAVGWIDEHQGDIAQFGKDLAGGVKDAVTWAQKLDWEAIGGGLKTAADAGKLLVEAFTNAPPWLQGFLTTGFLANKFTGGAVMDVAGILLGQVVKGVLGMNAGIVNINAGVVNGVGGVGGAIGGGGGTLASNLLKKALGVGAVVGGAALIGEGSKQGATALGGVETVTGAGGMILGGAAIAGPLGAMAGSLAAVVTTQQNISSQSTLIAQGVAATNTNFLAQSPTLEEMRSAMSAVDTGINEIQSNPLNVLVSGDALTQLQGMKTDLATQIARAEQQQAAATRDTLMTTAAIDRAAAGAAHAGMLAVGASRGTTQAIKDKDLSVTVPVSVATTVSIRDTVTAATLLQRMKRNL